MVRQDLEDDGRPALTGSARRPRSGSAPKWEYWGERLFPWFTGTALIILGPGVVMDVVDAPSGWRWARLAVWAALLAGVCWIAFRQRASRRAGQSPSAPARAVTADDVPMQAVREVVAATDSRVLAVKALRMRHPGLGLKTAADLVDAVRPRR